MEKPLFDWGEEFETYLAEIGHLDAAALLSVIAVIEDAGMQQAIRTQKVKKLEKNLYEIRCITKRRSTRACYFQIVGSHYYITHGFTKKTQKTPPREIAKARKIRTYILRKKGK